MGLNYTRIWIMAMVFCRLSRVEQAQGRHMITQKKLFLQPYSLLDGGVVLLCTHERLALGQTFMPPRPIHAWRHYQARLGSGVESPGSSWRGLVAGPCLLAPLSITAGAPDLAALVSSVPAGKICCR